MNKEAQHIEDVQQATKFAIQIGNKPRKEFWAKLKEMGHDWATYLGCSCSLNEGENQHD